MHVTALETNEQCTIPPQKDMSTKIAERFTFMWDDVVKVCGWVIAQAIVHEINAAEGSSPDHCRTTSPRLPSCVYML